MSYRLDARDGNHTDEALRASVEELLAGSTFFSLATSGPGGPHINTAFFAYDAELNLFFVSERSTQHSRNTADDPRAAVTVARRPPEYGEHLQGVQLSGVVHEAGRRPSPVKCGVGQTAGSGSLPRRRSAPSVSS